MPSPVKVVYKITYPNGKVYVGQDVTDSMSYFGSPDHERMAADFTLEQRRDFTIRREVLWESETATNAELNAVELRCIREFRANDPAYGYNQWPRYQPTENAGKAAAKPAFAI